MAGSFLAERLKREKLQRMKREIMEELDVRIDIDDFLATVEWDYETFHLSMRCYMCHVESGEMILKEHEAAKWLPYEEIDTVNWLPADLLVVAALKHRLLGKQPADSK